MRVKFQKIFAPSTRGITVRLETSEIDGLKEILNYRNMILGSDQYGPDKE